MDKPLTNHFFQNIGYIPETRSSNLVCIVASTAITYGYLSSNFF